MRYESCLIDRGEFDSTTGWMNSISAARRSRTYPLLTQPVPAGFPSPADDYAEDRLCIEDYLIEHEEATFFVRVTGHSARRFDIHDGDLLVVDRSLPAVHESVVVAVLDGAFTLKQLCFMRARVLLRAGNDNYPDIWVNPEQELVIWGVVRWSIHRVTG